MKKEGKDLIAEAVSDAKALKEAAITAAKNELIESMAPAMRKLLDETINGVLNQNEDSDRIRRGVQDNAPGESHTGFEEAKEKGEAQMAKEKDDKELDLESLANFFPQMAEAEEDLDMKAEDAGIPTLGEKAEGDEEVTEAKKKDDELDEEIEISEAELHKVYEMALQTEAQVTKGFADMTKSGELEDVVKDADKGLADVKKGEHAWEKEEPPAKQDFTVKEMKAIISKGLAENKQLRENLKKAVTIINTLGARLHEVNLFNSKVLHVNRILNSEPRLTTEQKKVVLESMDKANTIEEVKMVYETITNSFAATKSLTESVRKPVANAQRPRSSGAPDQKVLRESVDRQGSADLSRLQKLAGILK